MTMLPVNKEDLLQQFSKMPEVVYVRAEMVEDQLLCVGWSGTTGSAVAPTGG
jgi:hypothetical protein